jgi:hypothetical protein
MHGKEVTRDDLFFTLDGFFSSNAGKNINHSSAIPEFLV